MAPIRTVDAVHCTPTNFAFYPLPSYHRRVLFLALSCLHGRPKRQVADSLLSLGIDGLQLTPGCPPDPEFDRWIEQGAFPTLRHHGYCERALRQRVWDLDGRCLVNADSVHPPKEGAANPWSWRRTVCSKDFLGVLETMYSGYALGSGDEIEWAMDNKLQLAVDISHMHIQRSQGLASATVWKRLQDYDRIREVHVSENNGDRDTHAPLTAQAFGLDWAKEKLRGGTRVVVECMMFRMSPSERKRQLALLRDPS